MPRIKTAMMMMASATCATMPLRAQVRLDRADPTITEQALPKPSPVSDTPAIPRIAVPSSVPSKDMPSQHRVVSAIVVDGNAAIQTPTFAPALIPFIARELSGDDLTRLASAVAGIARTAGYPFASATIEPQKMADGVLHVTLNEGRIAAVRVIGAISPLADKTLTQALVTDKPVRGETLERAILLVGDIAGISVKDTKYVQQNGFGILLVTIVEDRATAYVQVDNRGSAEVGPIRTTMLASYRGLGQSGDELGLVAALTPIQPSEFAFLRGRYSAPVDLHGGIVTIAASYGRANPGGALKPLNVVGNSVDLAVGYTRPLLRSRAHSIWGTVELRALKSNQTLLGTSLRDDRLTTLSGSLSGTTKAGPGIFRGEVAVVGGLPLNGVTREGDPRTSRADGDARFVTWNYSADWTADLIGPFAVAMASSGQLASRPLLATAEIGVGGPSFARGYDYAERTGDQGILGSVELRANLGRVSDTVQRLQLYGFFDGGYVDNLRGGVGGGSLTSTGTGARLGQGLFDSMIEIAFPLNEDRFDTGTKRPRISLRLARSF